MLKVIFDLKDSKATKIFTILGTTSSTTTLPLPLLCFFIIKIIKELFLLSIIECVYHFLNLILALAYFLKVLRFQRRL